MIRPLPKTRKKQELPHIIVGDVASLAEAQKSIVAKSKEFAMYCDQSGESPRHVDLHRLMNSYMPRRKRQRIAKALEWSEKDDYLSDVIKKKTDFCIAGCSFTAMPTSIAIDLSSGKTYSSESPAEVMLSNEEQQNIKNSESTRQLVNKVILHYDIESLTRTLMEDWFKTETMILYWRVERQQSERSPYETEPAPISGVVQLVALSPALCDWDNSAGSDVLYYTIPEDLRYRVERVLQQPESQKKRQAIASLIAEGIPSEWIIAIDNGDSMVRLMRSRGDNWIVVTKNRAYEGFADPSMKTIFAWLTMRELLKEGEFSAAYLMKHFILHVTMGESIESGPLSGSRENWAGDEETEAMQKMLNRTSTAARVATNHTVKFNFVFPPKEMWDRAKYETPERSIDRWAGFVKALIEGDGATGSSGHLGIKQLIADIAYARRRIQHMFIKFFMAVSSAMGLPEETVVCPQFDQNILKDPRQILDELKQLWAAHSIDPETMIRETGRDPRLIRDRKTAASLDNQNTAVWRPLHETSFGGGFSSGNSTGNPEGRPANPGTTRDEDTRNQPATN